MKCLHDIPVGRQQTMVAVYPGRLFVDVAGADEAVMDGEIIDPFFDQADLGVHFHVGNADEHFDALVLKSFLQFEVRYFVEPCK